MSSIISAYRAMGRLAQRTPLVHWGFMHASYRRLARCFVPREAMSDGIRYRLDATDSMHLATRRRAPFILRVLQSHVEPGDVIADVGAHIGSFALPLGRLAGPSGRVYAFEPDGSNFALLRSNIEGNQAANIVAQNVAVSDKSGSVTLYCSMASSALNRIYPSALCASPTTVESVCLDDYFTGNIQPPDLIKIDVEGAEVNVLRGMTRLLNSAAPRMIVLEYAPAWMVAAGHDPRVLYGVLEEAGYRVFEANEADETLRPAQLETLLFRFESKSDMSTDLVCTRG